MRTCCSARWSQLRVPVRRARPFGRQPGWWHTTARGRRCCSARHSRRARSDRRTAMPAHRPPPSTGTRTSQGNGSRHMSTRPVVAARAKRYDAAAGTVDVPVMDWCFVADFPLRVGERCGRLVVSQTGTVRQRDPILESDPGVERVELGTEAQRPRLQVGDAVCPMHTGSSLPPLYVM